MSEIAAYLRASTEKQVDDHQRDAIHEWLDENHYDRAAVDWYTDVGSGADDNRPQFRELLGAVEDGAYTHVAVWEISRISRRGETLQRFFDRCEETDTTIVITDGAVEKVAPDGTGRFVADVIGMVYQQERRTLIRRIQSGVDRAQNEGKWLGQVPVGFERDADGYLQPNLDPDHEADEVGYLELRSALDRLDGGASYRSVARELPTTRQTLSKIHQDPERRAWYSGDTDAVEDNRVADAVAPLDV